MAGLKRHAAGAPAAAVLADLQADGGVILEGFAPASEVAAMRDELAPWLDRTPFGDGDFMGRRTRRACALIHKSPTYRDWIMRRSVLDLMDEVLGAHCDRYQVNLTQAIQIHPGEEAQVLHKDELLFPFPHPGYEAMANVMVAVDEFTAANGATRVVPGSHCWPEERLPGPHEVARAEMQPGDALVYTGSVIHGGGANQSEAPRTGVVLSYNLGFLRQTENQYLAVPRETAARLPAPLQRLMGYQIHRPNIGWVENNDPIIALMDEAFDCLPARDNGTPELEAELAEMVSKRSEYAALFT